MNILFAVIAYLFSIPGALIVYIIRRNDPFCVHHARQALAIGLAAVAAPLAWILISWILLWIPTFGVVIGLSLYALLIAIFVTLFVITVIGIIYALLGLQKPVPLIGEWAARKIPLYPSAHPNQANTTHSERKNSDA